MHKFDPTTFSQRLIKDPYAQLYEDKPKVGDIPPAPHNIRTENPYPSEQFVAWWYDHNGVGLGWTSIGQAEGWKKKARANKFGTCTAIALRRSGSVLIGWQHPTQDHILIPAYVYDTTNVDWRHFAPQKEFCEKVLQAIERDNKEYGPVQAIDWLSLPMFEKHKCPPEMYQIVERFKKGDTTAKAAYDDLVQVLQRKITQLS